MQADGPMHREKEFTLLQQVQQGMDTRVPGLSYIQDPSLRELRGKGVKHYGLPHQDPHLPHKSVSNLTPPLGLSYKPQ